MGFNSGFKGLSQLGVTTVTVRKQYAVNIMWVRLYSYSFSS